MEVVLRQMLRAAAGLSAAVLWAYIDPSSGSLLFQAAIASLISAGLLVKGLRDRITWVLTAGWRAKPEVSATEAAEIVKLDPAITGQIGADKELRKAA